MRNTRLVLACCSMAPFALVMAQDPRLDSGSGYEPRPISTVIQSGLQPTGSEHVNFAYAQVLGASPVYQDVRVPRQVERCDDYERVQRRAPNGAGGTVLGAIIGGVIGNQIGGGSGRRAATAAGAIAGGAIGHEAGRETTVSNERHCVLEEGYALEPQLVGYDVEYRYRGEVFLSRLDHHPGDRLRIRVAVSPAEGMDASRSPVAGSGSSLRH